MQGAVMERRTPKPMYEVPPPWCEVHRMQMKCVRTMIKAGCRIRYYYCRVEGCDCKRKVAGK